MTIGSLSALNEELSTAPVLQIEALTSEELGAVAGGEYELDPISGGTGKTHCLCHVDGAPCDADVD